MDEYTGQLDPRLQQITDFEAFQLGLPARRFIWEQQAEGSGPSHALTVEGLADYRFNITTSHHGRMHVSWVPSDSPGEDIRTYEGFSERLRIWLRSVSDALRDLLGEVLPPEGYYLVKELGEGAYKITYEAVQVHSREHVALKRYKQDDMPSIDPKDLTVNPLKPNTLHKNLIPTSWLTDTWLLESLMDAVLSDFLPEKQRLKWKHLHTIAVGLCSGLAFVHQRNLVHGDLKPQNMGIKDDESVLCDFGEATHHGPDTPGRDFPGTIRTRPPELHAAQARVTPSSDVWMLGASLFALVTGVYPFVTEDEIAQKREKEGEGALRDLVSQRIADGEASLHARIRELVGPKWFANLLVNMLQYDPSQRPSAAEVLSCLESRKARLPVGQNTIRKCSHGHHYDAAKWDPDLSGAECPYCWRDQAH